MICIAPKSLGCGFIYMGGLNLKSAILSGHDEGGEAAKARWRWADVAAQAVESVEGIGNTLWRVQMCQSGVWSLPCWPTRQIQTLRLGPTPPQMCW